MSRYCVNKNAQATSRDHEVHNVSSGCNFMPAESNRIDLGPHDSCRGAVQAAKKYYNDVNGCFFCATDCHTT